jgi:hypothetical protein
MLLPQDYITQELPTKQQMYNQIAESASSPNTNSPPQIEGCQFPDCRGHAKSKLIRG